MKYVYSLKLHSYFYNENMVHALNIRTTYYNHLITYCQPVCYFLKEYYNTLKEYLQYPVNTTYNKVFYSINSFRPNSYFFLFSVYFHFWQKPHGLNHCNHISPKLWFSLPHFLHVGMGSISKSLNARMSPTKCQKIVAF